MYLYCMFWETAAGHESIKQQLQGAVDRQRLGHGLMFTGEDGHGVLPMVIDLAQYILAKEHARAAEKVSTLNHVDLHFCFPQHSVAKSEKMDENSFYFLFREMYLNNAYSSLEDWIRQLDSENKQVFISSKQIEDVTAKFDLKSFEGGSKILVIWHADKLNGVASNKLLKFLEEPPQNTYIFLTCPNPDDLLATVRSRVQEVHIPRPSDSTIARYLSEKFDKEFTAENPLVIRAQGDINTAIRLVKDDREQDFEYFFIVWLRSAVMVRQKTENLREIILWSRTVAGWTREKQKQFLLYAAEMFRLALMQNYGLEPLVYDKLTLDNFKWESFAKFVSGENIELILQELTDAEYHLQRNGNPKVIFADMGIKLSRYISV